MFQHSCARTSHTYNGLEQRLSKQTGTNTASLIQYVYDEQGHLIGECDTNGYPIQETVYLGDMPIIVLKQTRTGTAPNLTFAVQTYFVCADHLNTPRVITQATNNQMVWRWDQTDPFGVLQPNENPNGLGTFKYNPRFPGQVYDAETNLNYNVHRSYDSNIGSYTSSDPIGFKGGWNTYSYVGGNPVNYSDPLGLAKSRKGLPEIEYQECDDEDKKYCANECGGCGKVQGCYVRIISKFKAFQIRPNGTSGKVYM